MEPQKRQIIVPLDGSALAETVLPHAAALAQATESALRLLRVVAPVETLVMLPNPALIPPTTTQRFLDEEYAQSQAYLNTIARQLQATELEIHTEVRINSMVADTIVMLASQMSNTTLIAMASHGHTGLRHLLMGSVAERVLHTTPVPLLLVRADEEAAPRFIAPNYHSIIVPLDGSVFAEQALQHAQPFARAMDADLILVGVGPTVDDTGLADGGIEPLWMLAEYEAEDERLATYLGDQADCLRAEGIRAHARLMRGDPAEQILRVCDDERAGLIVMSTHGRSGLRRLWLGSVARNVVQDAMVPVLLVRAQERALERGA